MRSRFSIALLGACVACGEAATRAEPEPEPTPAPAPTSSTPAPTARDAGARKTGPHAVSAPLVACAERKGELGSIADVVARLGALAPGADGPCFVATLPRPLAVVATTGVTSAQPAAGRESPRLFFLLPKLVISAVPAGEGSKVIELGEWVTPTRTLKGEIALPVTAPLEADAPFRRVMQGPERTICATCHRDESHHASIPNAFVSSAYEPEPGTFVTVDQLDELHAACTKAVDVSARCAMIHAVFDFGEVAQGAFAAEVPTFFVR
ncbi:MAG: hypothetical protein JST00_24090 [Deltaproteobacteria bacterium]|nr:hypothetical protein [Deltaproteobacteria bacterium]